MPFELRFYGEHPETVLAEVRKLLNIGERVEVTIKETPNVPSEPVVSDAAQPAPATRRARAAGKKDDAKQVDLEEAIAAATPKIKTEPGETNVQVTKDVLRAKLIELMNAKGEDVPSTLLQEKFAVSKIGELDPSKYGECYAAAVEALTEGDDD